MDEEEEGQRFSAELPAAFASHRGNRADRSVWLPAENFETRGEIRERGGDAVCVFSFSTLDLILCARFTRMNAGTHEK